ncbi:hypothetical protein EV643_115161 [Kribbella sp. VKM Ac-2527]|uniref:Uncharacterized protein n=1 Tax=Kribbella caucasensis TaxID=2512215 RepID=A0A4R6K9J3_9ACTN|nr:hypothetical protein [Kribbella sp. VKM Ac-2527]TDO44659.1 hypothetical protein EV643_115161 [Kribbella sp. VKM Ac-2527]
MTLLPGDWSGLPAVRRSGQTGYELVLSDKFVEDLRRLAADARRHPGGQVAALRLEVLRVIKQLADGQTDGHHALGYEAGKGDLRDCVTAYVQGDPQRRPEHRLVFRELGPDGAGGRPRRELLAIKPRQGTGNVYEHVCARLGRHPADRQPGLNRFGDRAPGEGGSQAERQAELDTKRAIAQAWTGQRPLSSSRPLQAGITGQRTREQGGTGERGAVERRAGERGAGERGSGGQVAGERVGYAARMPFSRPNIPTHPTGWPERRER